MAERLNLMVDEGVGDLLTELADGERRRGQYLSDVVRGLAMTRGMPGADVQTLIYAVRGVTGQVHTLEGRLAVAESQIAAMRAEGAGAG
jgi:hypothetical protein